MLSVTVILPIAENVVLFHSDASFFLFLILSSVRFILFLSGPFALAFGAVVLGDFAQFLEEFVVYFEVLRVRFRVVTLSFFRANIAIAALFFFLCGFLVRFDVAGVGIVSDVDFFRVFSGYSLGFRFAVVFAV